MDLANVKAAVKSWEKAFKASHGRQPTKEDIKSDPSDIASQYALYRKLSKSDSSSSQSSQSRPASSSTSASLSAGTSITSISARSSQSRTTPRIVPASDYPTTPTPPSRKSTQTSAAPIQPLSLPKNDPSKNLKRTASKAHLNGHPSSPPSSSRSALSTFLTPKKTPAYSGPIHDPNPINPFSATPTKLSPIATAGPGPSSAARVKEVTSPFIHASSPRKLREVLEANSLRKVKERAGDSPRKEITPRTRARKRLRGEAVDDTPMKDKLPRRKRGEGGGSKGANGHKTSEPTVGSDEGMEPEDTEEDEDEDEFGPSPMKPSAFTALLAEHDAPKASGSGRGGARPTGKSKLNPAGSSNGRKVDTKGNGKGQNDIRSMFAKSSKTASGIVEAPSAVAPEPSDLDNTTLRDQSPEAALEDDIPERISTPLPQETATNALQDEPPKSARAQRVLTIEEDAQDEWDPEGGNIQRKLVIVPTRRAAQRRGSSDGWDFSEEQDEAEAELNDDQPTLNHEAVVNGILPSPKSTRPFAPSLLSTLSLHSPHRRSAKSQLREDDLRVRAIFDPASAALLKAKRRGQDVFEAGESGGVDEMGEDEVLEKFESRILDHGEGEDETLGDVFGDDDWESENEGWKKSVGGGISDDEGW